MTDRELLELAAKAAGYEAYFWSDNCALMCQKGSPLWNPLEDDGDALRMADKLGLIVDAWNERSIQATRHGLGHRDWIYASEDHVYHGLEATRRAITRAAAEIGRAMP